MKKISAGHVIAATYLFVLQERVTLARMLWLPVFVFVFVSKLLEFSRALPLQNLPEALSEWVLPIGFVLFIVGLVVMLVSFVMAASIVLRHVLLVPETGVPAHCRFGNDEWRMVKATIWYSLLFVLALALGAIFGYGVGTVLENFTADTVIAWENMTFHAAVLGAIIGSLYPAVTIGILLYPMVLFEKDAGIRFTFDWSEGNFWPLLAIFLAISVPFWTVQSTTDWVVSQWLFPVSEFADIGFQIVSGTVIGVIGYAIVFVASAIAYESLLPNESDASESET